MSFSPERRNKMSFNFGAFAGGVGTGYMAGKEQQRKDKEQERLDKDQAHQDKEWEREDAYRKEMEGITSPNDEHKAKQTEIEASTADIAAKVVGNPIVARGIPIVARGITTAPSSSMSAASFGESMEPRSEGNSLAPSRPVGTLSSIIAANGIGATSMRQDIAKPVQAAPLEAPKAPGINDWLEFATKRAAIDVKYGKLNGLGIMQLAQARKQLMDEGVDEAVMKFQQGDAAGGLESFNASGKYVGAKLVGEPQRSEFDYNGVKMPTTIVTLKLPDGRTETINTAQYGTSRIKAEGQFNAAMGMMNFRQMEKHQTATEQHQKDTLEETRDYHKGVIDVAKSRVTNSGGVTSSQQRTNYEIDSARKHIAGLSPEEIKKRTQQYSATGRENKDFDPTLAAKVRQANHRKYGNDDVFDANTDNQATETPDDIISRFSTDSSMKGHRTGNKTPQGVEVLDANGKLIGHYN